MTPKAQIIPTHFFSNSPATFAHEDLKKLLEVWKGQNKIIDLKINDKECTFEF